MKKKKYNELTYAEKMRRADLMDAEARINHAGNSDKELKCVCGHKEAAHLNQFGRLCNGFQCLCEEFTEDKRNYQVTHSANKTENPDLSIAKNVVKNFRGKAQYDFLVDYFKYIRKETRKKTTEEIFKALIELNVNPEMTGRSLKIKSNDWEELVEKYLGEKHE